MQNNAVLRGQGGGFVAFNFTNPGAGYVTLTNSIIQNNDSTPNASGVAGDGGGGCIDARSQHHDDQRAGAEQPHAYEIGGPDKATGGGSCSSRGSTRSRKAIFPASTISGNTAAGIGGGIHNMATLLIDGGTVISNNTAGDATRQNARRRRNRQQLTLQ